MKRRPAAKTSWLSVVLIVAAVALWVLDQKRSLIEPRKPATSRVEKPAPKPRPQTPEKPADLPDGTPASRQRDHLRDLERTAKRKAVGMWAL
jgi:hypothetical protein